MFNNFSYRQFTVSGGPTFFTFSAAGATVRMQVAIRLGRAQQWTGSSPIRETTASGLWAARPPTRQLESATMSMPFTT
jgi:hypothetical protein